MSLESNPAIKNGKISHAVQRTKTESEKTSGFARRLIRSGSDRRSLPIGNEAVHLDLPDKTDGASNEKIDREIVFHSE